MPQPLHKLRKRQHIRALPGAQSAFLLPPVKFPAHFARQARGRGNDSRAAAQCGGNAAGRHCARREIMPAIPCARPGRSRAERLRDGSAVCLNFRCGPWRRRSIYRS